jgi:hypothetical protein
MSRIRRLRKIYAVSRKWILFVISRFPLRLKLHEDLPSSQGEIISYEENLITLFKDDVGQSIFAHLYDNLTILDAKCASLLQFNSVLMAVFAIFIAKIEPDEANVPGLLGILFALISSLLLLQVVWVHWSTSDHMQSPQKHMTKLLAVRRARTLFYRIAWNLSQVAGICLLFIVYRVALTWAAF